MAKAPKEDILLRNSLIVLGFLLVGAFTAICSIVVVLMTTNFNPLGWIE